MDNTAYNISLRPFNSFGVEARATRFLPFERASELSDFFAENRNRTDWYLLGGGNNIVITGDFSGTILHPIAREISLLDSSDEHVIVRAQAGVEWDELVAWCVQRGYGGIENLSAIPGYVGAAPVQNIGAYGVEVKETIHNVAFYEIATDTIRNLSATECQFGYRDSIFKGALKRKGVILYVDFSLSLRPQFHLQYGNLAEAVARAGEATLTTIRHAVMQIRSEKLPDPKVLGNAGSFFKNPVVDSNKANALKKQYPDIPLYPTANDKVKLAAGWLIEQCGWKGKQLGSAGVHDRQALVLVNHGGATGADILALAGAIQRDVENRFGVTIDMEVNTL